MPSNAVIFTILVSGFVALRLFNHTRYLSQAWDTTRVVLWSGFIGGLIFFLTRVAVLLIRDRTILGPPLERTFATVLPMPFAGTLVATGLVALTAPLVLNAIARRLSWVDRELSKLTLYQMHSLNAFLREEWVSGRYLLFTLEDRKVYVAKVFVEPLQAPREAFVEVLPRLSGHRESETLDVQITRDYSPILDEIEAFLSDDAVEADKALRRLRVVIPFDRLISVHGWDQT